MSFESAMGWTCLVITAICFAITEVNWSAVKRAFSSKKRKARKSKKN